MATRRKALVVGIDCYEHIGQLGGCVNDARAVSSLLQRNEDHTINFGVKVLEAAPGGATIPRQLLKRSVEELFAENNDVALLYFAGHGHVEASGGYICATDCRTGDDGLAMTDIMRFANRSPARNRIVILDSCHSGALGESALCEDVSEVAEGVTILTASTKEQYAGEIGGGGIFTGLMVHALEGAAANLLGEVTPGSVYAHIDQSLGDWAQRPVFKTNVKSFISLRRVNAPLALVDLQRIAALFPEAGYEYRLDPDYEPESSTPDPAKTEIFGVLQKYNRVGLAVAVGTLHPYHAAMESKSMKLTKAGEHYRRLAQKGLI